MTEYGVQTPYSAISPLTELQTHIYDKQDIAFFRMLGRIISIEELHEISRIIMMINHVSINQSIIIQSSLFTCPGTAKAWVLAEGWLHKNKKNKNILQETKKQQDTHNLK